jgi:hypothetical protein
MPKPVAYVLNVLERGPVTTTGSDAATPVGRLTDRRVILPWRDSATTGTRYVTGDQGTTGAPVPWDTWILPEGHNLAGVTLTVETSPDMSAWTARDTLTGAAGLLIRPLPPGAVTARGARLAMSNLGAVAQLAELLFTQRIEFPVQSTYEMEAAEFGDVIRQVSRGGTKTKAKRYGPCWRAQYTLRDLTPADRDAFLAAFDTLEASAKFFYLTDHLGVTRWCEWVNPEALFTPAPIESETIVLQFEEVLA